LVATFQPALAPITQEFNEAGSGLEFTPILVEGALSALKAGDQATHDGLIAQACTRASDSDVVCFAQFSMTSAHATTQAATGLPTLTTTDSAVKRLKAQLGN